MSHSPPSKQDRPLSPHLQVYRLPVTALMSIMHRATGAALSIGTVLVAWWLVAIASGPEAYAIAYDFIASPLGQFMLFGWSASLYYHTLNGIRHLIWDAGYLFKLKNAYRANYAVLLLTAVFTAATWYCAYNY